MKRSNLVGAAFVLAGVWARSAQAQDWWDAAYPFRVPVSVAGSGVAEVSVDFGALLTTLGTQNALLDVRSIRVVPYDGTTPRSPIPYAETYSHLLFDADALDASSGVVFTVNDGEVSLDQERFSQGTGSIHALIQNLAGGYGYPGAELHIDANDPRSDWSAFEVFLYDVWPSVNQSALDQAPDLYWFKMYDVGGCESSSITQGGPPLALDRWNPVSVSLRPLDTCLTPELNQITRIEFHTRDNDTVEGKSGLYDDGDQLDLWFDNLRGVDQDQGTLRFEADGSASAYYVYFDTLEHEGHPLPTLSNFDEATLTGTPGAPEVGGYLHQVSGADGPGVSIFAAPVTEKIPNGLGMPEMAAPLVIQSAKNEREPFQLVVRSDSDQNLAVSISHFSSPTSQITASNVAIHRVDTVPLSRISDHFGRVGPMPDPLTPIRPGAEVAFSANQNQALWFTVKVPTDAAAGDYQATVTIGTATIPVTLRVWDFALPPEIHLKGEWGFGWSEVVETYKGTIDGSVQDCYWDLVDGLYQDFASHRLTPKGIGWPAGLNYPGGVEYDCAGTLAPDAWGEWGFETLASWYLDGAHLTGIQGFPSFLLFGPSSNWPPDSRPSSFCDQERGDDPPGNDAYNARWFEYLASVSDYLGQSGYADRGYYHIVNEPQTEEDYQTTAYLAEQTHLAAPNVRVMLSEQVEPAIHDSPTYPGSKIDIWVPTITNYEVERSHERQLSHGEEVWWYFLYGDRPPLPNPTIIDRPGVEARIIPWLAYAERVDGLLYYSISASDPNPWDDAWIYDANGDGFMLYPPRDSSIATDACDPQSNRLVSSIRWELLSQGMEDYEYLYLLNQGPPEIGVHSATDSLVEELVQSRTLFSRVPTDLISTRERVAQAITGEVEPPGVGGAGNAGTAGTIEPGRAGASAGGTANGGSATAGQAGTTEPGRGGASAGGTANGGSATAGEAGAPEPTVGGAASGGREPGTGGSAGMQAAGDLVTAGVGEAGRSEEAGAATDQHEEAGAGTSSDSTSGSGKGDGCGCRTNPSRPSVPVPVWVTVFAMLGLRCYRRRQ